MVFLWFFPLISYGDLRDTVLVVGTRHAEVGGTSIHHPTAGSVLSFWAKGLRLWTWDMVTQL